MSRAHSISTHRRFGMSRICRIWGVPRATVYRRRGPAAGAGTANAPRPPRRRGPKGACSDAELQFHIQAVIAASPFSGEGYRKVWARLRAQAVRTAPRRVRRVMKENALLAPQRPVQRDAHPHAGTIVTDRVDEVWGTDMTQTVTTGEGRAYVFIAVDHCSGEFIGTHASSSATRWEALEPVRQGVTRHFGGPAIAQALAAFATEHNASWLRQRHGYKTPDQIRAEQKALEPEAAT